MRLRGTIVLLVGSVVGCAAPAGGVEASTDNLGVGDAVVADGTVEVGLTHDGGGTASLGSECRIGQEIHSFRVDLRSVSSQICAATVEGGPARWVSSRRTLDDAQQEKLLGAARAMRISSEKSCAPNQPHLRVNVRGTTDTAGAAPSYEDDVSACGDAPGRTRVHGADKLLDELRTVFEPLPHQEFAPPTDPPEALDEWLADPTSIAVTQVGGGTMPAGSTCMSGYASYDLTIASKRLMASTCSASDALGRLQMATHSRTLSDEELESVRAAAREMKLSTATTCGAGKTFEQVVIYPTASTSPIRFLYDDFYACRDRARHYVSNIDKLVTRMQELATAAPTTPVSTTPTTP